MMLNFLAERINSKDKGDSLIIDGKRALLLDKRAKEKALALFKNVMQVTDKIFLYTS
ncbi:MAG: hypothetical protein Q8M99_11515 [Methylotenera sp.]|nr:hypothetical protein [Methylotenera sp.]